MPLYIFSINLISTGNKTLLTSDHLLILFLKTWHAMVGFFFCSLHKPSVIHLYWYMIKIHETDRLSKNNYKKHLSILNTTQIVSIFYNFSTRIQCWNIALCFFVKTRWESLALSWNQRCFLESLTVFLLSIKMNDSIFLQKIK